MYYIIGSKNCSHCDNAKALLTAKGVEFTYKEITEESRGVLVGMGIRTVPAVFEYKGGFEELKGLV